MHWYENLPIIELADIEIHIPIIDPMFIFTKIPHVFGKIVILKHYFDLSLWKQFHQGNCPINRPTITNTDTA